MDNDNLPPGVSDPATVQTAAGAVGAYRSALVSFRNVVNSLVGMTGLLTDELAGLQTPPTVRDIYNAIDTRTLPEGGDYETNELASYTGLHDVRQRARLARGFLGAYAPEASPALAGHLYTVEGYAELYLADLYCSGIPLSTLNYGADFTLAPGSSTDSVYRHALSLFDSALTQVSDSVRVQRWTELGRGRALLALGRYAEAAAAVAGVTDDYRYTVLFDPALPQAPNGVSPGWFLFWYYAGFGADTLRLAYPSMADQEGLIGLNYRLSGDPRTQPEIVGQNPYGATLYTPLKYSATLGPLAFPVASGIEARLIEAEAALQAGGGDWLTRLNVLRTDGTFETDGGPDTLWHAGTGGVAGLRPLADPGSANAQVDLVFRERAFWLYLTAHRQGDLRRLIRQYQRPQNTVYPTGPTANGVGQYGTDVNLPVPPAERALNPQYTGCLNRNA